MEHDATWGGRIVPTFQRYLPAPESGRQQNFHRHQNKDRKSYKGPKFIAHEYTRAGVFMLPENVDSL